MFSLQNFSGGLCLNETGVTLLQEMLHMDPDQVSYPTSDMLIHLIILANLSGSYFAK